jgi:hypothetical protein
MRIRLQAGMKEVFILDFVGTQKGGKPIMKRIFIAGIAVVLMMMTATVSLADVPRLVSFQGKLYDSTESPLNGDYEVTFRIYDIDEGGTALWFETLNVSCEDGLYSVLLGETNSINLTFDGQHWLGVQITGDDELSPRYKLTTAPTAFRAAIADSAFKVSWTNLTDVPLGFADGIDDVGAAGGVSQINEGTGINVTDPTGPTATVAADIGTGADQVAAGNHSHHSLDASDGSPVEAVYVDEEGNVGIGTTSPVLFAGAHRYLTLSATNTYDTKTASLELEGASLSLNVPIAKIDFSSRGLSEAYNVARIETRRAGLAGQGRLLFSTSDGTDLTERLRIDENGNIGIGIVSPAARLDINGGLRVANTSGSIAGTIRWTGTDFEGYTGSSWESFTSGSSLSDCSDCDDRFVNDIGPEEMTGSGETVFTVTNLSNGNGLRAYGEGSNHNGVEGYATGSFGNGVFGKAEGEGGHGVYGFADGDADMGVFGFAVPDDAAGVLGRTAPTNDSGPGVKGEAKGPFGYGGHFTSDQHIGLYASGAAGYPAGLMDGDLSVWGTTYADTVQVGSVKMDGYLELYRYGSTDPIVKIYDTKCRLPVPGSGGGIELNDENGDVHGFWEADCNGTGSFFDVGRNNSDTGFRVDGNYDDTEEPRVSIMGSSREAHFHMDRTGNESVVLPISSISSLEIMNEPGVASNGHDTGITLTGGVQVMLSKSIVCPSEGYVLVIGTAQPRIEHENGTDSNAEFGVSDNNTTLPYNQDLDIQIPSSASTGWYFLPVTAQGIFPVASAGTETFYFLAQETSGTFRVWDIQLSLVFFPTSYAQIIPLNGPHEGDDTAAETSPPVAVDVAVERAAAESFNADRIEKELAEMRAELEALQQEMKKQAQKMIE